MQQKLDHYPPESSPGEEGVSLSEMSSIWLTGGVSLLPVPVLDYGFQRGGTRNRMSAGNTREYKATRNNHIVITRNSISNNY
ncbi:unnamed protein product [Caretta caretta]